MIFCDSSLIYGDFRAAVGDLLVVVAGGGGDVMVCDYFGSGEFCLRVVIFWFGRRRRQCDDFGCGDFLFSCGDFLF